MSEVFSPPDGLIYLSLGEEALPLLKKGVIPVPQANHQKLPWYLFASTNDTAEAGVADEEYLSYLKGEYQRLPENLRGLFTEEAFITQAESKRLEIEKALTQQQQEQNQLAAGNMEDWLLQRFFSDAYSFLAWQQLGFQRVWLGIDAGQWPQVDVQPVNYQRVMPAQYPERLLCDAKENAGLAEQRLLLPTSKAGKKITIAQQNYGLIRLPPKALRCVLFGIEWQAAQRDAFAHYWRTDFRYQRIPLAQMHANARQLGWQYKLVDI
ncbi:MAG: hypothetical protein WAO12_01365 [Venatoribacter sp.]